MRIFVTGATGFIGGNLVLKLVRSGAEVHALYRDVSRIGDIRHERIHWFRGDLTDRISIEKAMQGCEQAYHLAAFATLTAKGPEVIYRQNVDGTVNVLECAMDQGLKKVVFTSTAGVLGPSGKEPLDENAPCPAELFTHYIRSKALAEQKVREYVGRGMDIVIVNPSRVYGPGKLSTSNVARLLDLYLKGRWHIRLGNGKGIGNYVYVDDVSDGMILAMEKGRRGERYLLGGENVSFNEWFAIVNRITGRRRFLVSVPVPVIVWVSYILLIFAGWKGRVPPFTPDVVRRYRYDWLVSSRKAKTQLGYDPIPFEEGMKITIKWLNEQHMH